MIRAVRAHCQKRNNQPSDKTWWTAVHSALVGTHSKKIL
jgi:hypothetical protein